MDFMLIPLKKYADFEGRARRKEYWMFFLFTLVLTLIAGMIDSVIFNTAEDGFGILEPIIQLGLFIPSIAVGIRRMHDVGKSGWFILIPIYNIILAASEGEIGTNQYGPDPKNPENEINNIGKDDLV